VFLREIVELGVPADLEVRLHLDAPGNDIVNIFLQRLSRQPIGRDGRCEHAAEHGMALVEGNAVAQVRQVPGSGQAGRAGADDADAFVLVLRDQLAPGAPVFLCLFNGEALQVPDRHGLVDAAPSAGLFAGMMADHGADRRDGFGAVITSKASVYRPWAIRPT